jgi:hypothetical protein
MIRFLPAAAAATLVCGAAAAQVPDVNCALSKTFRCTAQGCEAIPLDIGIRFNLGTRQGCLTKDGNCSGDLPVESSERVGEDVIVRFRSNGMVLRVNVQSGSMVGGDASRDSIVFAYAGTCN